MRLTRKSSLKKCALVTVSTALALTGLVTGTGSAQADGSGPGSASNIGGTGPGNTDVTLDRLCNQRHSMTYNLTTGEFKIPEAHMRDVFGKPYGSWRVSPDGCDYAEASPWPMKAKPAPTPEGTGNRGTTEDK
ncbi:hypothetical protein [Streptomyces sp. NPDC002845]